MFHKQNRDGFGQMIRVGRGVLVGGDAGKNVLQVDGEWRGGVEVDIIRMLLSSLVYASACPFHGHPWPRPPALTALHGLSIPLSG